MKFIIIILLILQFIWFPKKSEAALSNTVKQQIQAFYTSYKELHPRDQLFVDVLNLNMNFEMTSQEKMSEVERIYRGTRLWQQGSKLVTSLDGMVTSDYEEFVKYLSESYFSDIENRPAVSLLANIVTAQYFGAQGAKEHELKQNNLLPHFLDASVKWSWAAAGAWWLFGGGKGYKVKVPGKVTSGLHKTQTAIINSSRAVRNILAPKNPNLLWTAASKPFVYLFNVTKFLLWSTPKFIFQWKPLRVLARETGVLAAIGGGSGLLVGYPSWVLYQNGYFRKSDFEGILEQGVYDMALVKLACDVAEVKKGLRVENYIDIKDTNTISELEKDSKNLNELAQALNDLVDIAPFALSPYQVNSAIRNDEGRVSFKAESFECEALRNSGTEITVSLVDARDNIAYLVSKVVNKVNELKYGAIDNPVEDLFQKYKMNSVGIMSSRDEKVDINKIESFIAEGVSKEQLTESVMRFSSQGLQARINPELMVSLENHYMSLTDGQRHDFEQVAQDLYMSLSNEKLLSYSLGRFSKESQEASGRATAVLLFFVMHKIHLELSVDDPSVAALPSVFIFIADLISEVEYLENLDDYIDGENLGESVDNRGMINSK